MKNRTVIGILCIVVAIVITFGVAPLVNRASVDTKTVIRAAVNIEKGARITEDKIETGKLNSEAIPEGSFEDQSLCLGSFATADIFKGDVITSSKVTSEGSSAEDVFSSLGGEEIAYSVAIENFASGLSGKLKNGDVISFIVTNKYSISLIPPELKYVRVITTTTSQGIDRENISINEDGSFEQPATITVAVSEKQATLLAAYGQDCEISTALVYRGDSEHAGQFIEQQKLFLEAGIENE